MATSAGLLYSTNVFLKHHIQQRYRKDVHYVWCSEAFDSGALARYTVGAGVPPTSNPVDIYRDLKEAVRRGDSHNAKILEQKASFLRLAVAWLDAREISQDESDEIVYLVTNAPFITYWRPLIYVIPRGPVEGRLERVPAARCAGLGPEYIIRDLKGTEFDLIEP